jgi:hypothetical protein
MVKFFKRRKLFDEDADWVPQKGRAFKMKARMQKEETREEPKEEPKKDPFRMTAEPPDIKYDFKKKEPREKQQVLTQGVADQRDNIKTDAEGMDRAYAQGDVYGEGNKEYVAGSHTMTDWFDDFTKIPQWQYVPAGLNPIVDVMNTWWGREVFGTGDLRQSERYKRAMDYLVAHPEVTFLDGHSLGGAVVLQLQKDFPERNLKTFTQGAPVFDPLGTQKAEIGAQNVMRVSNKGDIVSFFDNSAKKTNHPDPFNYAPSFWHDFHNKEQAGGTLEGVPIQDNTVKTTWDTQPFNPMNINKNLTYDKTEGTKMTE